MPRRFVHTQVAALVRQVGQVSSVNRNLFVDVVFFLYLKLNCFPFLFFFFKKKKHPQSSSALRKVLSESARTAPTLALQMLHSLTEKERPDTALLDCVLEAYEDRDNGGGDARLLVPLLGG